MTKKFLVFLFPLFFLFSANPVYSKIAKKIYFLSAEDLCGQGYHPGLILKSASKYKNEFYVIPLNNSSEIDKLANLVIIAHHYSLSGLDLVNKPYILFHSFLFYS